MYGFPAQYPVIISHEDGTNTGKSIELELLPGYVTATADQYNINKVKLIGNHVLSEQLADDIQVIAKTQYSNINLEIEVE